MADNKTARRFAITAIPQLVEKGFFDGYSNITNRMAVIALTELALYNLALADNSLEIEETEMETRLRDKKIFDFNPLKLTLDPNDFFPDVSNLKEIYGEIKKEVLDANGDYPERTSSDGMVGPQKKVSIVESAPKRVARPLSISNCKNLRRI